jgi:hypothetical protein
MVHFVFARSCSHRAEVGGPRGASPREFCVPQAPSYMGANIGCEQGKPGASHQ